ncbi:MAG TPA: DUF4349 domain-containing protein [Candidatus Limnocylindrales bacterium]|nr:DUF4349 domain-containing protein [Candidatus Limnocylindrales bacterium]
MKRSPQHAFEPEEVMAYLDGELDAQQASALASHLEHCSECQALAAQLRQVSERMLDLEVEACPATVNLAQLLSRETSELPKKVNETGAGGKPRLRGVARRLVPQSPLGWAAGFGTVAIVAIAAIVVVGRFKPAALPSQQDVAFVYEVKPGSTTPGRARTRRAGGGGGGGGEDHSWVAPNAEGLSTLLSAPPPPPPGNGKRVEGPEIRGPMIVQTAAITILANNYDQSSSALQPLTVARGGYVQDMTANTRTREARSVSATLRVPEKQLDGFLGDLRKLGHVEEETRSNQEVTDQYIDLTARLKAARATEQRILELLATRTGKLSDVLEAEQELERVRGEIESMDGERVHMEHEVSYATVKVQLNEEYRAELNGGAVSTGRQIRNSAVEGFRNLEDGAVALILFGFEYGPSILFWLALLGVPAWLGWWWYRRHSAGKVA